jgi:hypothetical protein
MVSFLRTPYIDSTTWRPAVYAAAATHAVAFFEAGKRGRLYFGTIPAGVRRVRINAFTDRYW